jgi:serine/threonine protein phosphatase PrpC
MFEMFKAIRNMHRERARMTSVANSWTPSLPLSSSMAMAVPGGTAEIMDAMNARDMDNQAYTSSMVEMGNSNQGDALFPPVPRLRLPQKVTKPLAASTSEYATFAREHAGVTPHHIYPTNIHEIPTQPTLPPLWKGASLSPGPVDSTYNTARSNQQLLQVGVGWDAGLLRRNDPNEDSVLVLQGMCSYKERIVPFGLFCVADGMGGHADGKEASRIAIERMMQTVLQNIVMGHDLSEEFLTDMLVGGVEWANLAIYHHAQTVSKDMGTTITAALVLDAKAYIANVGDSRTYIYREGEGLLQVTRDHSLVATLVEQGKITHDDIYTHPDRSKIYRSLGYSETLEVDSFIVDLCLQDRLLLCSDGLWEMVHDVTLERVLRSCKQPTEASNRLVQAALRAGGVDNISAIVVLNS